MPVSGVQLSTYVVFLPILRPRVDRPSSSPSAPSSPSSSLSASSASSCSRRLSGRTPPLASIKLARMASSSPASACRELSVDRRLTGDLLRLPLLPPPPPPPVPPLPPSVGGGDCEVRDDDGGRGCLDRELAEDGAGGAGPCDVDEAVEVGLAARALLDVDAPIPAPPLVDVLATAGAPDAADALDAVVAAEGPAEAVALAATLAAAAAAAAAALTLRSALPLRTGSPPLPLLRRPRFVSPATPSPLAPPVAEPPSSALSQTSSSLASPGRSCVHRLLWLGGFGSSLSLSRARSAGEGGRKMPPRPRAFVHFLSVTCRSGRHFSQKYSTRRERGRHRQPRQ